jgi:hypothetical protein
MPVMPTAEVLEENKQMASARFDECLLFYNGKFFTDVIYPDIVSQWRWSINKGLDWGLMLGLEQFYMPYLSVDFKVSILKTDDFFLSYDLNLAGSFPYIEGRGLVIATKKFGFLSLSPVLGMELLGVFPIQLINFDKIAPPGHTAPFYMSLDEFLDLGIIINFQFENTDEKGIDQKYGFGLGCLYKKCITSTGIDYILPNIFIYKIY